MSDWYVDDRCTNCDVARQLAPGLIGEVDGRSEVLRQPRDRAETDLLHLAAHACHTRSVRRTDGPLDQAADPFPFRLDEGVYLCGHNSTQTAGANSYLLTRGAGNVLIDTPRWNERLAARYEEFGPVTDVFLTHRDHAAHGRQFADRLGARLWIHEGDLDSRPDADQILRGIEPVEVAEGVMAHPLPGHTEGSVLYVVDDKYCFSGDSFYWSRTSGDVEIAESVTWYSVAELATSLARSVDRLTFEWLLPGHGDRKRLPAAEMRRRLRALAARTAELQPQPVDFAAVRW
ncbi:MBL fold metallo-hydrolase [Amycolatopsis nigrescens]|uniref:MBL fold metallo-hydrolase n=1 Tax=Amycolatopsis nigrescens TaxID=381445 RepID=UPI000368B32D|nr:MBL fold metallo-hydrolase [Amycolatopsis nigrescens]